MTIRSRIASALVALASASMAMAFGPVLPSPVLPANAGGAKGLALTLPNGCAEVQLDANLLAALPAEGEFTLVGFPLSEGRFADLELERFQPFSRDAAILVGQDAPDGSWAQEPGDWRPTVQCFRGTILGQPRSMVFLSFDASTTEGMVIDENDLVYSISDGGPNVHGPLVVTSTTEVPEGVFNWARFACDTVQAGPQRMEAGGGDGMPRAGCKRLEVAIDTDKEFVRGFATKTDAMNYLAKMMGAMSTIYYQQLTIDAQASFVRIWAANSTGYPYGTGYSTSTYLADIYKRWTTTDLAQSRDIVAMISGQNLGGGRAYGIGGICSNVVGTPGTNPSAYCVCGSMSLAFPYPLLNQNNANWDPIVFLHEVGHVLGGIHTHDTGDDDCFKPDYTGPGACTMRRQGTIMSYCHQCTGGLSNINFRFSDRNKAQIASMIASTSCVTDCPALNSPTNLTAACENGGVRLNWDAMPASNGFVVYRWAPTDIVPKRVPLAGGSTNTFLDNSVAGATTYTYHVRPLFPQTSVPNAASADFEGPASNDAVVSTSPPTPTNLLAPYDVATREVALTWNASAGAATYEVWRALGDGASALLTTTATNSYTDTLPVNRLGRYKVIAVEAGGCKSAATAEVLSGLGVTNLVATEGDRSDGVNLTWTAVPTATAYRIYRADGKTGTPADTGFVTVVNEFLDDSADVGAFYNYAIVAVLPGPVDSDAGNTDFGWRNAEAPANVAATDCTLTDRVQVTWDASTNATSYDVYRGIGDSTPVQYKTGIAVTSYSDVDAYPNTPYTYAIRAHTSAGDTYTPKVLSALSATNEGCRSIGPPSGVAASDGTSISRVVITFTRVPGVTMSRVYRSSGGNPAVPIAYTDRSPYEDKTAEPGVLYTYSMTSVTALGETAQSNTDTGWRNINATSRVTATDGSFTDRVTISWTPSAGATDYELWRSKSGVNGSDPADLPVLLTTTADLTFTDLTALPGTLFSYSLFPRCALGRSTVGTSDLGWCNILPPTGVTATDGTSNVLVLVQWDAALNATGYAVYRLDPASATGPVRIGSTRAAVRNFSDRTARPGKLYYYTVRSTVTQGESQPSLADAGWRNNPSGPNPVIPGGGGAEMPMTDGGGRAAGAASLTLAGPRNTDPTEPADGGGASNPQDADPLMAPIVATDAAWALDCEGASVAELRDAVRAGARDHDGNGEPDLCQRERGDLDLSGTVDEGDLALLLSMMGDSLPALGDFDHDGVIDREDLRLLSERIATERALPEMAAPARANTARSSTDPAR